MFRTKKSVWDIVVIGCVLLVAGILLLFPFLTERKGALIFITTPEGSEEYSLLEDRTLTLTSRDVTLTVVIQNGSVSVSHSDCPDGICKNSRPISKTGESIVCAPAGIALVVKGGEDDVDFVAG